MISQSNTRQGQVICEGIGPGSNTQQVHLTYFNKWGSAGVSGARIAHKMDRHFKFEDHFRSFARWPEHYHLYDRHEIEMRYSFHTTLMLPFGVDRKSVV